MSDASTSTACFGRWLMRLVTGGYEPGATLHPEEDDDEDERCPEQHHCGGRGKIRRRVLEGRLVDVELGNLGCVARPTGAVRDHVDVVENPGDHRGRLYP